MIGAHGRPDEHRSIAGGVSEVVVRRAPVPVSVVR
ncbi:universal stress protein [Natronobacterium gregoryi]